MKKLILVSLAMGLIMAGVVVADQGFVNLQSIYRIESSTNAVGIARKVTGPISLKSDSACTVYLNMSTTVRSKAGYGWPLAAATEYKFNVPPNSTLTFLCATSATVPKYVYIVR